MKIAPKHPFEKSRIDSLKALNILDSLPEKDFDQITQLASFICQTPIALISLVDENRQWFKSHSGLDATETHRDLAFCAHAILQDEVLIVEDASKDERFFDNPLATDGPRVQFYAGAPLYSPDGYPIGTVCVIDSKTKKLSSDQINALKMLSNQVTRLLELKLQIKKLRTSEEHLIFKSTAAENVSEGIVFQDSTSAVIDFNPAALRVLGLSAEELTGQTSLNPRWRAIHEDGSEIPGDQHPAMICLKTGQKQTDVIVGVHDMQKEVRWLKVNSVPIFLKGSEIASHAVTSFTDISSLKELEANRRNLEAQLFESARLSELGEMASGIAHEINNPLAIIRGKAGLLKRKLMEDKFDLTLGLKEIQLIESTVDRIAKIIKGLRTYSKNAAGDPFEDSNILSIIKDTLELCNEKFKVDSIEIKLICDKEHRVECRPSQISQILMSLLSNSHDAIENLSEKWIEISVIENLKSFSIFVKDSGNGINREFVKKIMQPFFTTKEVGKGMGLGLSVSTGIAETHGGHLNYLPEEKNTTFALTLPKVQSLQKTKVS
jgi:PAS domain S-box-containing protein